jgi:WD40 repeat protein/serine/threonine protein kinase
MLSCPFCGAELGAASNRLRGGRCPTCGSILSWDDQATVQFDVPLAPPPPAAPAVPPPSAMPRGERTLLSDDEDAMPMRDIVRTLVNRGPADAGSVRHDFAPSGERTIQAPSPYAPMSHAPEHQAPPAPPHSKSPTAAIDATIVTPAFLHSPAAPPGSSQPGRSPPGSSPPGSSSPPEVEKIWRGSATVASRPSMTLKAATNEPDPAINDLLIRPFRIGQPGDPPNVGAEYELEEVIGEGGVGVVYAARQASIDRTVAIKTLREEFAHKRDHRNKFLSEAVVTGELDHPNIVPIYDLGTSDTGMLFYAMKRVRGTPWSDVVRHVSLAENLRVLMSVADAIAFAHSRGVVHRDLKPENIMLGDYGEVLVMDWGIALSTSMCVKSDRISQTTSMGGTPAYMAPELALGPLDTIGPPADVYLLGAMLYEVITGQAPHTGADVMQCLYAAARNEIQPTDKTGELLDIAYRAMATQPADRYAGVQAFQTAIREYQSHSESILLSAKADEELAAARKSRDYQDFARAMFAFQEAASLWSGNERAKAGEVESRLAYAKTALEKEDFDLGVSLLDERHPQQAKLRRQLVSAQKERSARQARFKGLRRTAQALAAAIFVVVSCSLFFILRQYQRINGINAELHGTIIDLKATQNRLALEKQNVENEKLNVERSNTELTRTQERLVGSNVALVAAKQTAISEAQTARQEEQNAAAASYRAQIGVAAERIDNNAFRDAERLLDDYQASQWSYFRHWEWGHLKWLSTREAGEVAVGTRIESLARSADGKLLAVGTASGQVLVFAADWPSSQLRLISGMKLGGPVTALDLSPDGSQIAAAGDFDRGAITLFQRQAERYEPAGKPLTGHPAGVLSVTFSPRGDRLLSAARDSAVRLWNIATGSSEQTLFGHSGPVWAAAFSPDGQQIVTAGDDATVRLWRVGDNQPRIYRGHDGPVYTVAFAPAGNWIASAGRDRDVHVWKADKDLRINYEQIGRALERERRSAMLAQQQTAAGSQPAAERQGAFHTPDIRLPGHTAEVRSLSFSADGHTLLSGGNDNTLRRWAFEHSPRSPDFVTVFRGHGGWIRGCVLAADDRYAASGSLDGTIKLWDAAQYEEVRTLRGHEDAVYWAAFSHDGERIITAGRDRRALLWNRTSREPVLVFDEGERDGKSPSGPSARLKEGHDFLVTSGLFFPDERQVATSAGDGTVRIWDRNTGGQIHRLAGTGTLGTLALSRDGRWLVTGSDKTDALLWRTDNLAAPAARLSGHASDVGAAAVYAPPGGGNVLIATGDVLGGMRLFRYDASSRTARLAAPLNGHAQGYAITGIAFTADGRRVLSASQDRTVLLHDAASGERQPTVLKHHDSVRALDVSADGTRAITLCSPAKDTYRITLWELAGGASQSCDFVLPREAVTSVSFDAKAQRAILASSSARGSRLWQWDLASPSPEPLWPGRELRGTVWSATPSPDGTHILAVGGSQARLLTADQGELERIFSPHGPVTAAAFSPLGRLVATCSSDGDVKLWSVDPQDENYGRVVLRLIRPHQAAAGTAGLNFVAFAPQETANEATLVTAGDDGTAKIWQIQGGTATPKATLTGHRGRVRSAVYSPDGKLILTASDDRTARLWDAATGQPATIAGGVLKHPEIVLFATFSPDGQRLITGCDDNNAYVFDLSREQPAAADVSQPQHVLTGHTAAVTSAAISPDGRRAATGSQDGIAKLWDLESGKEVLSLKRHTAELTAVHFAPDGDSILTSSLDQTALLWPAVPIGPSIKLSAPRLTIGRDAGQYPIDSAARLVDPDASDLGGATLHVSLAAENNDSPAMIELAAGPLRIAGNQVLAERGDTETPIAERIEQPSPTPSAAGLAIRFLPAATTADGQELLRQLAARINAPLDAPLTLHLKLTASTGQPLSETQATVQSTDATDTPAALAAAQGRVTRPAAASDR